MNTFRFAAAIGVFSIVLDGQCLNDPNKSLLSPIKQTGTPVKKIEVSFDKSCEISEIKPDPNDKDRKINWKNSSSWLLDGLEEPKSSGKLKKISLEDSSLLNLGSSIESGKIKLSSCASITIDSGGKELRKNSKKKIETKPRRNSEDKTLRQARRSAYRKSFAKEEELSTIIDNNESSILKGGTKIKKSEKKLHRQSEKKETPRKKIKKRPVFVERSRYYHKPLVPAIVGGLIDSPITIGEDIGMSKELLSSIISVKDTCYLNCRRNRFLLNPPQKGYNWSATICNKFLAYQQNHQSFLDDVIRYSKDINQIIGHTFGEEDLQAFICYKIIKAWATAYAKYGLKSGRDVLEPWQNISVLAHDYMRDYMEDVENYKRVNHIN